VRFTYFICILVVASSCIPVKIAPKFKNQDYKIVQAKKFKRKLPRETAFIFKDPKNDGEFYNYINTKYKLKGVDVRLNTLIQIDGKTFYLTYHETDKDDATLNLPLVAIDATLESKGYSRLFEDGYSSRKGHWYILITIYDEDVENALLKKHPMRQQVEDYLVALKHEYLTTHNYEELYFKKKP